MLSACVLQAKVLPSNKGVETSVPWQPATEHLSFVPLAIGVRVKPMIELWIPALEGISEFLCVEELLKTVCLVMLDGIHNLRPQPSNNGARACR